MAVDRSSFLDHDESRSSHPQGRSPGHYSRKRRKLNEVSDEDASASDNDELFTSSCTLEQSGHEEKDQEDDQAKSKSKYKIHIPKHAEIPTDAFFTQPPPRSASPYRIDQFHWQKPRKPASSSFVQLKSGDDKTPPSLSVNGVLSFPSQDDGENVPPQTLGLSPQVEDEFAVDESYADMLADLPSDAFSSPIASINGTFDEPIHVSSQQTYPSQFAQPPRLVAPLANLRQTTLFGTQAPEVCTQTQSVRKHNWPLANREESLTHHKLDREALKTWVYPTNLGTIRDYQYSIVARGLYHNMLVALPTGLGKTFIAATIMLNWFRWTTDAQIVFVAPTKPLVSQQVKACFDVAGIPRSATTMLTGGISPGLRAEEWQSKRVFFMTPQTIVNDLKTGICDPKKLVLLVVDEAHRATGGYAYVEVVKFLRRFNTSFRVLALTATPGSSIESVQEVIDGLGIARVEIRTEESLDIRQYVHSRKIETILFDNSDEMVMVMDLFSRALQPVLDKLNGMNAYWARDPMTLTPYGCSQARQRWMGSEAGKKASFGIKGMVNTIFSLLASLAHGIELLKFHGIGPFYHKVLAFRNEISADGKKGGKYAKQINESEPFNTLMSRIHMWINNADFLGHPKLEYLQSVVMNHFLDAGEGRGASDPSSTKVMVFAHYRDSAEEIARVLKRNGEMVRPHVFVGQANSKGSEGMDQKQQLDTIRKFQSGIYNTLVATSIGEEGLDIGEVDLIICYDASASPIRMLQRMGRTGRKRTGNIVVTLMKGKEENNFVKAKDNYEKMQSEIAIGTRFRFCDEESKRIVPKDIQPVVDKRVIDIPLENTQPELPEPSRRGRPPKRPPKKFHMPDGVRTGFVKASRLSGDDEASDGNHTARFKKLRTKRAISPAPIPSLDEVLLTATEQTRFERGYLDIQGDCPQMVEVPRNDSFPNLQRTLRPTKYIAHGQKTKKLVSMLRTVHNCIGNEDRSHETSLTSRDKKIGLEQAGKRAAFFKRPSNLAMSGPLVPTRKPDYDSASSPHEDIALLRPRSAVGVSSSEDNDDDGNVSGLINDDTEDEENLTSPISVPPPLPNVDALAFQPVLEQSTQDAGSEDELPDFGTLVQNPEITKAATSSRHMQRRSGIKLVNQRGGRKITKDDSDVE